MRQIALIALGSNLQNGEESPVDIIKQAIHSLTLSGLVLRGVSRLFQTPCFPQGAGPDYINACVEVLCTTEPQALLALLHKTEADFGRQRLQRWGSRTLDLDLLAFGDRVHPDEHVFGQWFRLPLEDQIGTAPEQLILPHPRIQDRAFVLVPLADIAPNWTHPVLKSTVRQMRDALKPEQIAEILPI